MAVIAALINKPDIADDIDAIVDQEFWSVFEYSSLLFKTITIKKGSPDYTKNREQNTEIPDRKSRI